MPTFHIASITALAAAVTLCVAGCSDSDQQKVAEATMAQAVKTAQVLNAAEKAPPAAGSPASRPEVLLPPSDSTAVAAPAGASVDDAVSQHEPVDFRELKALLPTQVVDLRRGEPNGEKTVASGKNVSHAEASYWSGTELRMQLRITDASGGLAGLPAAAWAVTDINRDSDAGYEKSSLVGGRRIHEKWDAKERRGELDVVVGGRFIVEIRGKGIEMSLLRQALAAMDLRKLERLKTDTVAAAPHAAVAAH